MAKRYVSPERDTDLYVLLKIPHFGHPEQDLQEATRALQNVKISVDSRAEGWLATYKPRPEESDRWTEITEADDVDEWPERREI